MTLKRHLFRYFKRAQRFIKDLFTGNLFNFARIRNNTTATVPAVSITQEIKPSQTLEEKVTNLRLGAQRISEITILPGELFSFWHTVGPPTKRMGFKESRSIVNNELKKETGGGLCQLSGLVYHLAMKANLRILERYNHSVDIYKEDERFTPLGSDATVVFGYKDLRFQNNTVSLLQFQIDVTNSEIKGSLFASKGIETIELTFAIENETEHTITTKTCNKETGAVLTISTYRKPQ